MKAAKLLLAIRGRTPHLKPPLGGRELLERLRHLPGPVPTDVRDLLGVASGLEDSALGEVNFLPEEIFGFTDLIPLGLPIATDESGNAWVIDIRKDTGEWGPVLFVSHDPPVLVVQADSLASFIEQVLGGDDSIKSLLALMDAAVSKIWLEDPFLIDTSSAQRAANDPLLREFALNIQDAFRIADLRLKKQGTPG
jgi:hypothetical protein